MILTGNLLPGQYTVEELLPEDSLYECKGDNPQTVTVTQGETAEVSFVNALRTGKVTVEKIDITGSPLAGATFRLEWSAEGSLWYPVTYSETIVRGGCSNPDVQDGCLTTEADGILEWDNLYPGLQYRLTETKAPDGYKLLTKGADFLKALGLADGAKHYENADHLNDSQYFYQSDVLIDALAVALESNSTTVKNALESYVASNGGTAMPLTDAYGKTAASDLDLGLYLVVETKVPEMVVSTTDPFLVSVPMTSVNGTNASDGGTRWIYDITLYPKNLTGIPTLEKTLRESKADTGKHNGSTNDISDGYAHTGTASDGDIIDYQIISTLPSITSESTYLSCYTFIDTLSKGLTYTKGDVVLEFFTDAACTNSVAKWTEADGKFNVTYNTGKDEASVMTIEMSADGLKEINTSKAVYSDAAMVNSG